MSADPRLSDLLLQWEELSEQKQSVSVEELCRDCPDLLDELRRRIHAGLAPCIWYGNTSWTGWRWRGVSRNLVKR